MFVSNPFVEIATSVPNIFMQIFFLAMIALVALGTFFDIIHK